MPGKSRRPGLPEWHHVSFEPSAHRPPFGIKAIDRTVLATKPISQKKAKLVVLLDSNESGFEEGIVVYVPPPAFREFPPIKIGTTETSLCELPAEVRTTIDARGGRRPTIITMGRSAVRKWPGFNFLRYLLANA